MARPLRLQLAGALYHVTSRGDGQEDIYLSDTDRETSRGQVFHYHIPDAIISPWHAP